MTGYDPGPLERGRGERLVQGRLLVSSGFSVRGHEVAVVEPATEFPVSAGKVGEIWFRGPAVAEGYWNRPELTQEKFIAHPFRFDDGAQIYVTNNLSRFVEFRTPSISEVTVIDTAALGVQNAACWLLYVATGHVFQRDVRALLAALEVVVKEMGITLEQPKR